MHGLIISNDSTLQDWDGICRRWDIELQRAVISTGATDAPYIHTEHGNTHHFGVSASLEGHTTFREVIGTRDESKGGRLDLCFVSKGSIDMIEVKHMEICCSKKLQGWRIEEKLIHALADVRSYQNKHDLFSSGTKIFRRVGVLFITPYFPDSFDEAYIDMVINFIKNEMKKKPDILAWSFPIEARNLKYWNRLYPGVIMVASRACDDID